MFVLKRYSDAAKDGDRVYGLLRGIGLSNDGRGQSVLSPNAKGQVIAFERAYRDAQLDPKAVQYVECHATGTPVGDKVELSSMDTFFGAHGAAPLVGSVKSNLGHMLTAAGMASMTKVLFGMREGMIPGTINLKEPLTSPNQVIAAPQIPSKPTPWPQRDTVKRAAVNVFGFGGTNAHAIFEASPEPGQAATAPRDPEPAVKPAPMAIVGMDAHFGSCDGLSAFHRTTYEGTQHFGPLPENRWKGIEDHADLLQRFGFEQGKAPPGAYIERFDLDFLRFKIPPNEEDRLIPQQLIALKVADNALAMETELETHQMRGRVNLSPQFEQSFAQNNEALSPEQRAELEALVKNSVHNVAQANQYTSFIGNIMPCRVASLWDFSGPAFTVSSEENSVFRALELAQMMLDKGEVEAVVVGGVDLAGGVESILWRNKRNSVNAGQPTLSFDQNVNGWLVGEGAGAVALKRADVAREKGDRIYANIDALAFSRGVSPESVTAACHQALEQAGMTPPDIGYVEVSGSGRATEDEAEVLGLTQAYEGSGSDLRTALGSVDGRRPRT
jgi:acyl transferase domain-containing protein